MKLVRWNLCTHQAFSWFPLQPHLALHRRCLCLRPVGASHSIPTGHWFHSHCSFSILPPRHSRAHIMEKKVYINLDMNMYVCVYYIYISLALDNQESTLHAPKNGCWACAPDRHLCHRGRHLCHRGRCHRRHGHMRHGRRHMRRHMRRHGRRHGRDGRRCVAAGRCCASRWRGAKPRAPVKWRDNGLISGNLTACYGKSTLIGEPSIL